MPFLLAYAVMDREQFESFSFIRLFPIFRSICEKREELCFLIISVAFLMGKAYFIRIVFLA